MPDGLSVETLDELERRLVRADGFSLSEIRLSEIRALVALARSALAAPGAEDAEARDAAVEDARLAAELTAVARFIQPGSNADFGDANQRRVHSWSAKEAASRLLDISRHPIRTRSTPDEALPDAVRPFIIGDEDRTQLETAVRDHGPNWAMDDEWFGNVVEVVEGIVERAFLAAGRTRSTEDGGPHHGPGKCVQTATGCMPKERWYTSEEGVAAADATFGKVEYRPVSTEDAPQAEEPRRGDSPNKGTE